VDYVEKPASEIGAGASLIAARRLRPRLCVGWGGWHWDQLSHFPEVWAVAARRNSSLAPFGPRRRRRSILRMRLRCANSLSTFISMATRDEVSVGRSDIAGEIPGALVDRTQDRARWLGRATAWLESAGVTIELAGAVAQHAVLIDERPILAIDLLPLAQPLAGRADMAVVLMAVAEG